MEIHLKKRPLPEADLARIAILPIESQRPALERVRLGAPPFSYRPVRQSWPDILNMGSPMFGATTPTEWCQIERLIRFRSRTEIECQNNLGVAAELHSRAISEGWQARVHEIYPILLGGERIEYWLRIVLIIGGVPHISFFDPRRSTLRMTEAARRFAFSVMHEGARAGDPDLSDARLAILQFDDAPGGGRILRIHTDGGIELYGFDELDRMTSETYSIWADVLEGREVEMRRRGSNDGSGSLI